MNAAVTLRTVLVSLLVLGGAVTGIRVASADAAEPVATAAVHSAPCALGTSCK